jgi:hypothetical protein
MCMKKVTCVSLIAVLSMVYLNWRTPAISLVIESMMFATTNFGEQFAPFR